MADDSTNSQAQQVRAANAAISRAKAALPDEPLRIANSKTLHQYEVVIAFNIDPPYRYAQEIFWLEVLAERPRQALQIATEWATRSEEAFEVTDMVRDGSPHERYLGINHLGEPLTVAWNLPIDETQPAYSMIRNPKTGLRVGFLANAETEQRWLLPEGRDRYRLIVRKPTAAADPVCLAPVVMNLSPIKIEL